MDSEAIALETRERVVRIETKLDVALTELAEVKTRQEDCPARQAFLSRRLIDAQTDLERQRMIALTGWIIAIVGGLLNFAPKALEYLRKVF